uniref:RNase H type-1 domain-containing protein n=1 Tax=Quercus lobata TaxID=97700 RepID=A0A7N2LDK2_QUELO
MDIIDIAMEFFESGTSSDLEIFIGVAWAIWSEGKWIAPPLEVFKINVDGATSEIDRNSSVGVVIRDAASNVHAACCRYLQSRYSVEEVEALAMECGLLLAKEHELSQIILEFDTLTAVSNVTAAETSGCLGHVYQGILSLLSSFSSWKIKHVKREYNRAAHELAQYTRMKEESHSWKGVCPPMVIHVIQEDGFQLFCVKLFFLALLYSLFYLARRIQLFAFKKIIIIIMVN